MIILSSLSLQKQCIPPSNSVRQESRQWTKCSRHEIKNVFVNAVVALATTITAAAAAAAGTISDMQHI